MENTLLKIQNTNIPIFSNIEPKNIEPTINTILKENRQLLKKLLDKTQKTENYTWDNFIAPLIISNNRLHKVWGLISHLNNVLNSEPLREAYHKALPKLSDYFSEISHNKKLYNAIQSIAKNKKYRNFNIAQKKIITNELRDFKLSGITLAPEKQREFAKLQKLQTKLGAKFSENVLDATQSWNKLITDKSELAGLPSFAVTAAKELAQQRNLQGWLLTLEPTYSTVMLYSDYQTLRKEFYTAYTTRASDQGPNANHWDNTEIIDQILKTRLKLAKLLKFKNFAEYALTTRMAKNPGKVIAFLNKLAKYAKPRALQELQELKTFAKEKYHIDELQPWDIGYYSEKLKEEKYQISQEALRPYFSESRVLDGLFIIIDRLFDIKIKKDSKTEAWHSDVKVFDLFDNRRNFKGKLYIDLYARPNKKGGAWMSSFCSRHKNDDNSIQFPVAYIICNFNKPSGKEPSLFNHDEVHTLFHEFGHALQHLLTTVDYDPVSGLNGIPNDAIEIASQFMENWCWEKSFLNKIAKHYKTGKPLPVKMFNNMIKAKNFQSGMQTMRQIEFALFDIRLHNEFNPRYKNYAQKILDDVRSTIAIITIPKFNRFQNGFSHIFANGHSYASGYYSYKWSEVLSSDAFAKFLEDGKFNKKTGKSFLHNILESGGAIDPMILFKRFRGRAPKIDALLKQDGILP